MPEPQPLREKGVEIRSTDPKFMKLLWDFLALPNCKPNSTRIVLLKDNLVENSDPRPSPTTD
jgi:hypothetical protein